MDDDNVSIPKEHCAEFINHHFDNIGKSYEMSNISHEHNLKNAVNQPGYLPT